ncbi:MAG: phosphoribosylamine--glycine ligase [Gemmatimonadetes bacterium]|nr:phosphoribosylamine--glycine ligase [Gemmatimonadota bacterium]
MKVLVVGTGGREHALLWKLHRDHPEHEYLIAPGNGGTGDLARAVDVIPSDVAALRNLAEAEGVEFTVVGPEGPLAAGVVDAFRAAGLAVFGPTRAAARLESSKAFAKRLMRDHGIPTARFEVFTRRGPAAAYAAELGIPCVVKVSGLAAGKGAFVCTTDGELEEALAACFDRRDLGTASDEVVVEECLEGEELSMIALTDGDTLVPLLASQDHKRALDGDRGPNTGGMGAYAPVSIVDSALRERILREIFHPTLAALAAEGVRFTGTLYAGLMLTAEGPKVLEWNVRFGDPEAQAILPLLETDLLDLLMSPADSTPEWGSGSCVTVVAAAQGYPGDYSKGAPIEIPADLTAPEAFERHGAAVFHAGTRREDGRVLIAGGRVLDVTAVGADIDEAREKAYAVLERIRCPALRWRSDIGWREAARLAAETAPTRSVKRPQSC